MSDVMVGSEACSLYIVVKVLRQGPTFWSFQKGLGDLARELAVERHIVLKIRRDLDYDKISLTDAVEEVIAEWTSRAGSEATVTRLISALDESGLKGCAHPLREKYLGISKPPKESISGKANKDSEETTAEEPEEPSQGKKEKNKYTLKSVRKAISSKSTKVTKMFNSPGNSLEPKSSKQREKSPVPLVNVRSATNSIQGEVIEASRGENKPTVLLFAETSAQTTNNQLSAFTRREDPEKYGSDNLFTAIQQVDASLAMKIAKCISREAINEKDENGESALHLAARLLTTDTQVEVIRCLIDNGGDVSARDSDEWPFLLRMLETEQLSPTQFHDFIVYLVDSGHGSLFNEKFGPHDTTILQEAVYFVKIEERTLDLLHSKGVDFNAASSQGRNILFNALECCGIQLFSKLVHLGADVKCVDEDKWTLLHFAAASGIDTDLTNVTKMLVENGVGVNATDNIGWTAIMHAVWAKRSVDYLKFLVELGADWKVVTMQKSTILTIAAEYGTLEALEYFLKLGGVSVKSADNNLNSPLHCAVLHNKGESVAEKVKLLLSHGAYSKARNKRGQTTYELAKAKEITSSGTIKELGKMLK